MKESKSRDKQDYPYKDVIDQLFRDSQRPKSIFSFLQSTSFEIHLLHLNK